MMSMMYQSVDQTMDRWLPMPSYAFLAIQSHLWRTHQTNHRKPKMVSRRYWSAGRMIVGNMKAFSNWKVDSSGAQSVRSTVWGIRSQKERKDSVRAEEEQKKSWRAEKKRRKRCLAAVRVVNHEMNLEFNSKSKRQNNGNPRTDSKEQSVQLWPTIAVKDCSTERRTAILILICVSRSSDHR